MAELLALWFVIQVVGIAFALFNLHRFWSMLRHAMEAKKSREAIFMIRTHMWREQQRIITLGCFTAMGLDVVNGLYVHLAHQHTNGSIFTWLLILGSITVSVDGVFVWRSMNTLAQFTDDSVDGRDRIDVTGD